MVERLARSAEVLAQRHEREACAATCSEPTEREQVRFAGLVIAGRGCKQIADELDISVRTVDVHRARVFDKMDVKGGRR